MKKQFIKLVLANKIFSVNLLFSLFIILLATIGSYTFVPSMISIIPGIVWILIALPLTIFCVRKYFQIPNSFIRLVLILMTISTIISLHMSGLNLWAPINIFRKPTNEDIKVFVMNTHFWEEKENIDSLHDYLLDQDADIYILQEFMYFFDDEEQLFIDRSHVRELEQAFPDYTVVQENEYVTISKFPVIDTKLEGYQLESYLRTDLDVNGEIISFYNVHIPVHVSDNYNGINEFFKMVNDRFEWRKKEFKLLADDIDENTNKIFVAGDFNTTNSMFMLHLLPNDLIETSKYSKSIFTNTWSEDLLPLWEIDHVFIRKNEGLKVHTHKPVSSQGLSDHKGIIVEFQIKH